MAQSLLRAQAFASLAWHEDTAGDTTDANGRANENGNQRVNSGANVNENDSQ